MTTTKIVPFEAKRSTKAQICFRSTSANRNVPHVVASSILQLKQTVMPGSDGRVNIDPLKKVLTVDLVVKELVEEGRSVSNSSSVFQIKETMDSAHELRHEGIGNQHGIPATRQSASTSFEADDGPSQASRKSRQPKHTRVVDRRVT